MQSVSGKKVLVLGLARSGLAVARLLLEKGARVQGSDQKTFGELGVEVEELQRLGLVVETGGHDIENLRESDFVVVSPGVPDDVAILRQANSAGIPIYSELEVASWWAQAPMVAVTGSNGKTTTTTLLGNIFRGAGWSCQVAGNIGAPLSAAVKHVPHEGVLVVEVSSFQLEHIEDFRPQVGVILNITPDHLDRHGTMEAYQSVKMRLLMNQAGEDVAVLNRDDPRTAALEDTIPGKVVPYSICEEIAGGVYVQDGQIISQVTGPSQVVMATGEVALLGPHNLSNSLAAIAAAQCMGVHLKTCAREIALFKGLEHRLELIGVIDGVKYVNDSKATNVEAVEKALLTFSEPIVLIAGGRDKNGDFDRLAELICQRVHLVLLFGEAREKIRQAWRDASETMLVDNLEQAVRVAHGRAHPGDCVLLSPACASFDMFHDFEHRGRVFKKAVNGLKSSTQEKSTIERN